MNTYSYLMMVNRIQNHIYVNTHSSDTSLHHETNGPRYYCYSPFLQFSLFITMQINKMQLPIQVMANCSVVFLFFFFLFFFYFFFFFEGERGGGEKTVLQLQIRDFYRSQWHVLATMMKTRPALHLYGHG